MPAIFPLLNLPAACALGLAVAFALGALALRRRRAPGAAAADGAFTEERSRAAQLAAELLRLSRGLESEAASHRRCVADFALALARLERAGGTNQWAGLRSCADQLVAPTLALATSLRLASDELNASLASLSAFSGSRIDAATNLHNRRSLQERLEAFFSMHAAGRRRFALAMFHASPADDAAEQTADGRLRDIAQLLEDCIRDGDFVARYSHDEFIVLMPHTVAIGALAFSERLIVKAHSLLRQNVCGGVVEAAADESPEKLLSRADSALYSARAAAASALFHHTGTGVRRYPVSLEGGGEALLVGELESPAL